MKESFSSPDVSCLTALYNAIIQVCILTAVVVADNERHHSRIISSREALGALVEEFIKRYDIGYVRQQSSPTDTNPNKKRKMYFMIETKHHNVCDQTGTARFQDLKIVSLNVPSVWREAWEKVLFVNL